MFTCLSQRDNEGLGVHLFTISLCLVYKISPLYLKSLLGALPKDVKSSGMLNEKAIGECRAESRVPEQQSTREWFFNSLSFSYKDEKGGCHQSYNLHSYEEQVLRLAVA